jgi:hypothetical protein
MNEISPLADAIRPFWLAGINEVSGHCRKELKAWINDGKFQVYIAPSDGSFTLHVSEIEPLLQAYAAEISRTSLASNETMSSVLLAPAIKKSTAWLIIQTYYATFFAAHSLVRVLGTSCLPLDALQIRSISKISKLFGQEPSGPIGGGLYRITFTPSIKQIQGSQLKSMKAGPHEGFWGVFSDAIKRISTEMLDLSTLTATTAQSASGKLSELLSNLNFNNSGRGSWLSTVRNAVNYDQRWATWYPYSERRPYYDELLRHRKDWLKDPLDIDLILHDDKDLRRFQATCNFIMALSRNTIEDMAQRCSRGTSFHEFGSLAFRRLFQRTA